MSLRLSFAEEVGSCYGYLAISSSSSLCSVCSYIWTARAGYLEQELYPSSQSICWSRNLAGVPWPHGCGRISFRTLHQIVMVIFFFLVRALRRNPFPAPLQGTLDGPGKVR